MLIRRSQRLNLLFSFMLGVVLTAVIFTVGWLETNRCAGRQCTNQDPRLRRVHSSGEATSNYTSIQVSISDSTESSVLTEKLVILQSTVPPSQSSPAVTIPTVKYGRHTHPVPSEASHYTSISMINRTDCTETGYCREHLSPEEGAQFAECTDKCSSQTNKFGPVRNGDCHFMKGQGRLPVALASFPGSGNTWTRGLLEKVTGICTGALYCDCGLRNRGFTGEGIKGPSVIAMKTHNLKVQFVGGHFFSDSRIPYGAALLLVRDPRGALVAEWNRERSKRMVSQNVSNHFIYVGQEYFGLNKDWDNYIHTKLPRWPQQVVNLLLEAKSAHRPVHIIVFEDLKSNTVKEMKRVTDFLGFSLTEQEVSQRLDSGFTKFYRNHTAEFSHFTLEQEQYIHDTVASTIHFMKENEIYEMFPRIDEYL